MPIPVSRMVKVLFSLSGMMSTRKSLPVSSMLGSDRAEYRILSQESLALLMSSRRKISLLLYTVLMIRLRSWLISAWNVNISVAISGRFFFNGNGLVGIRLLKIGSSSCTIRGGLARIRRASSEM